MSAGLKLDGELTIYRAAELRTQLREALAKSPTLQLDLAEVSEIDTAGVQLLLAAEAAARQAAGRLVLQSPSAPVRQVLGLLQLQARFEEAA